MCWFSGFKAVGSPGTDTMETQRESTVLASTLPHPHKRTHPATINLTSFSSVYFNLLLKLL